MSDTELFEQAVRLSQMGKHGDAASIYRAMLDKESGNATAWHYLAITEQQMGKPALALESIDRAIQLDPLQGKYCSLKGNVLQDLGKLEAAEECFLAALKIDPDFTQAYNNLGIVLRDLNKSEKAIEAFRLAIAIDPNYFRAHNNLGSALQSLGLLAEASDCYQRAIELQPDYFIAMHNLASANLMQGRYQEAGLWFNRVIKLKPDYLPSYLAWGRMLLEQYKLSEAELFLTRAVEIGPRSIEAHNLFAEMLTLQGKYPLAMVAYQKAAALDPTNLATALGLALALPQVYRDSAQIQEIRSQYESGLRSLLDNVEIFSRNPPEKVLFDILWNNFNLAYQGLDDKPLQKMFSVFVEELLARIAPKYMVSREKKDCSGRRIRIGFLSSFFYKCTAGKYFSSWLTHLDKSRFQIFVYHTNIVRDEVTDNVMNAADQFKLLNKPMQAIAEEVLGDDLDLLVYPEIGMSGKTHILSAMRLAPVQCAGWGHPITSGHANIDYYFSSELMEPAGADQHYTEKLLLLPGLGTFYPNNILPSPALRSDFSLPGDKTLYLCPQSLFKFHPDNDKLLLRILQEDKNAVLVLFSALHEALTNAFISRLANAFDALGMDKLGRIKILPILDHDDYLRVNRLCDLMLDTLYWSGGNTSLDALSCGLPIVTLPGELMRSRQSLGMLRVLDIPELVAKDEDDYVRIALMLGKNPSYRKDISERILNRASQLFEDEKPIRFLENHFSKIVDLSQATA